MNNDGTTFFRALWELIKACVAEILAGIGAAVILCALFALPAWIITLFIFLAP